MKIFSLDINAQYFFNCFYVCLIIFFIGFNKWNSDIAIAQEFISLPSEFNRDGVDFQGIVEQFSQLQKNQSDEIPSLPDEVDITQEPVIWLSCKPGGPKVNNTLVVIRPTIAQPTEAPLAETAVWHDMRLTLYNKHSYFMRISQRRPKPIPNYKSHSVHPNMMQATNWIKTKENQIVLTDGKPVQRFTGGQLTPEACHGG